jgi:antitoxin (DNA-binding transcriptional repressor) of toxin-antitoxin stability system
VQLGNFFAIAQANVGEACGDARAKPAPSRRLSRCLCTVTIRTAKTTLSQRLARVDAGEEIGLARGKHPIAKLVPYHPAGPKRQFGALRGVVSVGPAFFEPLPTDELAAWEQ